MPAKVRSGVRPGAHGVRPQSPDRLCAQQPLLGRAPAPAQGERSTYTAAFRRNAPLVPDVPPRARPAWGGALLRGPPGCAELGPAVLLTPGPGSLDSKILVKASELPVHFLDVPAETGRPWGRGGSLGCGLASVACDLVTLGGPGFPLGSPSPWGCRGLRETERSCVVSSKAPPGGGFVNGGGW